MNEGNVDLLSCSPSLDSDSRAREDDLKTTFFLTPHIRKSCQWVTIFYIKQTK
jgi:hypothetical protein